MVNNPIFLNFAKNPEIYKTPENQYKQSQTYYSNPPSTKEIENIILSLKQ